jgi:lipase
VRLKTYEWGPADAPALVCVHGVTAHGMRFRRLAEEKLDERRVIAVDLRGHGHSGWEPPWNIDQHLMDLAETVDALGVGRATWVGFSFGGRLVADLALRDPWRVEKIVLLDPALRLPASYSLEAGEDELTIETYTSHEDAVEARIAQGGLVSTPREFLEEEMRDHLESTLNGRLLKRYSRPAAIAAWGEMARPTGPPADLPTLMVLGDESQVPNAEHVERYRASLGERFTLRQVKAGHNVLWDAFDATGEAVRGFA